MLNRSTFIVTPTSRDQDNGVRYSAHGALATAFVVVVALSTAVSGPAAAANPRGPATARVFYGDLDLKAEADARRVWLRISQAANNSCGRPRTDLLPRAAAETHRCRLTIIVKAVRTLKAPLVTAQFDKVYGPSAAMTAAR
jgi:UrcA family protein